MRKLSIKSHQIGVTRANELNFDEFDNFFDEFTDIIQKKFYPKNENEITNESIHS